MNGVTPEHGHSNDGTAPVGQNEIHINLINYKHRCMRQFFGGCHSTLTFWQSAA